MTDRRMMTDGRMMHYDISSLGSFVSGELKTIKQF